MKQDYYVFHLPQTLIHTCLHLSLFLIMVNSVALSHIWYQIITKYLRDYDIYHLCVAFPIFKDMFPTCEFICYKYEIEFPYQCEDCFLRFPKRNSWLHHDEWCEATECNNVYYKFFPEFTIKTPTGKYKCSFCRLETSKEELHEHVNTVHKGFDCNICWKSFINDDTLSRHICNLDVIMPEDEELETMMMSLGEENTNNEDPMKVIIEGTSGDGFEQEILADYKSQDYEFIPDMTTREVASPNDDMDWLFIDEGEASM